MLISRYYDPVILEYLNLNKKLQLLEQTRHEEKVNIKMLNLNKDDLSLYSEYFKQPDQQQPHQQQLQQQKQQLNSLLNHLNESLDELKKKSKATVDEINETYDKILDLRQSNEKVSLHVEKEKEKRKRVNSNELLNEENNEKRTTKKKKISDQPRTNLEIDDSDSEFEEEERKLEINEGANIDLQSGKNRKEDEEDEEIEEIEIEISPEMEYDDREEYENAQRGEEDPSIVAGTRILVYWKGNDRYFKGRVVCWNEMQKQYEIDYDDEAETIFENLTGPSKELWQIAPETRQNKP